MTRRGVQLVAFTVVAVLAVLVLAWRADATRPVPGYDYPDVCKNRGRFGMPGVQTVLEVAGPRLAYVSWSEPNRRGRRACVVQLAKHG